MKALNGEHYKPAPYGYIKSPTEKGKLIINVETTPIVRRVYQLCMEGKGPLQIARILKKDMILTPSAYINSKTGSYATETVSKFPYDWTSKKISEILSQQVYLGHVVNGKTTKPSFKLDTRIIHSPEEYIVVKNMHEPLIDEETFEIVQRLKESKKRPPKSKRIASLFSGILLCGDCGKKLRQKKYDKVNLSFAYVCHSSQTRGKDYCTTHYINLNSSKF